MICPKGYEEQTPKPERLVEDHITLVKRLAWHFQGRAGRFIELDDLMQAGYLGLVDASQRYSTREGVTFAAYAAIRVRGSIIDCLGRNSNLCRTTISMQQKVRAAEHDLEMEHQRAPTLEELSEKMEMTLEELQNWQARFLGQSRQIIGRTLHRSFAVVSGRDAITRRGHASIPTAHDAAQGNFAITRARGAGSAALLCGRIKRL